MLLIFERLVALKATSLFADLDEELLAGVAETLEERRAAAGEVVVSQGEAGAQLFVIASGRVAVDIDGRRIAEMTAGDYFGEMDAFDPAPAVGERHRERADGAAGALL